MHDHEHHRASQRELGDVEAELHERHAAQHQRDQRAADDRQEGVRAGGEDERERERDVGQREGVCELRRNSSSTGKRSREQHEQRDHVPGDLRRLDGLVVAHEDEVEDRRDRRGDGDQTPRWVRSCGSARRPIHPDDRPWSRRIEGLHAASGPEDRSPTPVSGWTPVRSAEQVVLQPAHERGHARAVVSRDVPVQAADAHGGLARVLGADEVGGGRGFVGDAMIVACSSRPAVSGRPRQSSSACRPAIPIATSHWPVAPGAAERVGDDAPPGGPAARRAAHARTRPGRAGAGSASPARRRWTRRRPRSRTRTRGGCGR